MSEPARLFAVPDSEVWVPPVLSPTTNGRVAELRAEVRLLELGHEVARPTVDTGVDLVVDYRLRVQVKSSAGVVLGGGSLRWEFEFRRARRDGLRDASNAARRRDDDAFDVLLLYARDADVWWVVPADDVRGLGRVRIVAGGANDSRWREAWRLLR